MSDSLFDVQQGEAIFAEIAQQLSSQGFCVLSNTLPAPLLQALIQQVQAQSGFSAAGIGRAAGEQKNKKIRGDKIAWIDADTPANQAWISWCDGLKNYLNRRLYLGLFSYESHYAVYQSGDFYRRHVDAFASSEKGSKRLVSMVTYLNADWPSEAGGELLIYSQDEQELSRVTPQAGTIVVFLSEEFPHEVLAATQTRYSIATWFRLNDSSGRIDPPR